MLVHKSEMYVAFRLSHLHRNIIEGLVKIRDSD